GPRATLPFLEHSASVAPGTVVRARGDAGPRRYNPPMAWSTLAQQFCLELGFGVLFALAFAPPAPVGAFFYRLTARTAALPLVPRHRSRGRQRRACHGPRPLVPDRAEARGASPRAPESGRRCCDARLGGAVRSLLPRVRRGSRSRGAALVRPLRALLSGDEAG